MPIRLNGNVASLRPGACAPPAWWLSSGEVLDGPSDNLYAEIINITHSRKTLNDLCARFAEPSIQASRRVLNSCRRICSAAVVPWVRTTGDKGL